MLKAILAMTVLVTACTSPPEVHEFQKTWILPSTYDQAWSATIQLFAEKGWPIATLEKESGIIVSDWIHIGTKSGYADCGNSGLTLVEGQEAKFNIFLMQKESGPSLTVNTNFRELRIYEHRTAYTDCTSTGSLETELHSQILARINLAIGPLSSQDGQEPALSERNEWAGEVMATIDDFSAPRISGGPAGYLIVSVDGQKEKRSGSDPSVVYVPYVWLSQGPHEIVLELRPEIPKDLGRPEKVAIQVEIEAGITYRPYWNGSGLELVMW